MSEPFAGQWVRKGGVLVPVFPDEKPKIVCKVCGGPSPAALCRPCRESDRKRVHGSHAGFAQHVRRNEKPCRSCELAEKEYQGKRYKRGQLSAETRVWCEKNAVKMSWEFDTRTNRRASVANTSRN